MLFLKQFRAVGARCERFLARSEPGRQRERRIRPGPGLERALRSRMTYPHTLQATGKQIGTIEERRSRFYFRQNTQKEIQVSRHFFLGPVAALYVRFWGSHPYV